MYIYISMCVSACRCTYVGTCLELRNYTSHTEAPLDEGVACFFGPSRMRGAPLCLMGRRSTIRMRPANLSMLSGSFFFFWFCREGGRADTVFFGSAPESARQTFFFSSAADVGVEFAWRGGKIRAGRPPI